MKKTYYEWISYLNQSLAVDSNFDIVKRVLRIHDKEVTLFFIDGLIKDDIMEKMMEFMINSKALCSSYSQMKALASRWIPYVEVEVDDQEPFILQAILTGTIAICVEGYTQVILVDARTYPTRGMNEPEDDKVLRGSRDGFVETIIFNTALIRRRIKDVNLCMEYTSVGNVSRTDIVICYMKNKVDPSLLKNIRTRLEAIEVEALTMAQESLAEALIPGKWYSPFPKIRYSERPDVAASNILEGKIIVIIDNTPSIMILPTHFFDFVQEAQDYYLPPITGIYLRCVRIVVFLITLLMTPIWFYFIQNESLIPEFLSFIKIEEQIQIPIYVQLLLLEFGIDALKLASLNTPSSLNGSFSIIGALILGDFAVKAGWFHPEVILYMAFVALANFTLPSYELGYALKFSRVLLLSAIALSPKYGLFIGILILVISLIQTKTLTKQNYLYPVIPFSWKNVKMIFMRKKITDK